jgi:hypothetical protein
MINLSVTLLFPYASPQPRFNHIYLIYGEMQVKDDTSYFSLSPNFIFWHIFAYKANWQQLNMVYKPLSEAVKLQKSRAQDNARMRRGIDEYKQQELKPKNLRLSYKTVANLHNVSKSTLQRLVTGGVSMSAFNTGKQRLTLAEERVVVDFCLESADRGFPLTHGNVYKCADNILLLAWVPSMTHLVWTGSTPS